MVDTNSSTDRKNNAASGSGDARVMHLERRLLDAFDELWDSFVDPADAFYDADGARWNALGGAAGPGAGSGIPFIDEQQLAEIRGQCRALAAGNEFAINGHETPLTKLPNYP